MDPSDSDSMMERGRGRALFPRQTSALKSVGNALQRSSSGYGTGEKSQSFGTASIVRIFILLYWLMMIFLLTIIIPNSYNLHQSAVNSESGFTLEQGSEEAQCNQAYLDREQALLKL
jgi:hypothetical protein